MRAVDAIRVVIAETAVLNEEVVAPFVRIIGNPYAALKMLYPTIANDGVGAETVLEPFADLIGTVIVVVTYIVDGIQIESFYAQVIT